MAAIRYVVTRHAHLDGVRLSRPGHWGNLPFPSDADATSYAIRDAGAADVMIDRPPVRQLKGTLCR